jgi:hypothetical protein
MTDLKLNLPSAISALIITGMLFSCNNAEKKTEEVTTENLKETIEKVVYDIESPKSMLLAVSEACGGIDKLKSLNDVEFDYHYLSPDGKSEISKERYIFDNEISWARYSVHELNVSPDLEGDIVQFYDGESITVHHNGQALNDSIAIGTAQFLRQANYMWFNMMFKLSDPGIIYKYEGQEEIEGTKYDVVNVTYDAEVTGKEQNDIFVVYINPETRMVESFDFSLPVWGIMEPVLHAQLTYEEIDGIMVITRRIMTGPDPDGKGMVPMLDQQLKNIRFNNGFTATQLHQDI